MVTVATWTGGAGEDFCQVLTFDGTYIYAGLYISPAKVIKINLSTMATISIWTAAAGENQCRSLSFDGEYLFLGVATTPAKLIRKIMRDIDETGI